MSTATRDVPIDQLCALPLKKRLQLMEALLESIEDERRRDPSSEGFADPDRRYEEDEADSSDGSWQEVRTVIRTVCTHYFRSL
jgi:hypothetical protein